MEPTPLPTKPSIGLTTKLLIASFAASLIPLVQQIIDNGGELPGKEALLSFGLVVALGVLRVFQQVILDTQNGKVAAAAELAKADSTKVDTTPVATGVL